MSDGLFSIGISDTDPDPTDFGPGGSDPYAQDVGGAGGLPVSGPTNISPLPTLTYNTTGDPTIAGTGASAPILTANNIGSTLNSLANLTASALGHGTYFGTSSGLSSAGVLGNAQGVPGTPANPTPTTGIQLPAINVQALLPWILLLGVLWLALTVLKKA